MAYVHLSYKAIKICLIRFREQFLSSKAPIRQQRHDMRYSLRAQGKPHIRVSQMEKPCSDLASVNLLFQKVLFPLKSRKKAVAKLAVLQHLTHLVFLRLEL